MGKEGFVFLDFTSKSGKIFWGGPWSILIDPLPGSSGRTSFPSLRAGYLFLLVLKFRLTGLFCYCSSPGVTKVTEAETLASCPEYLLALGTSHFGS